MYNGQNKSILEKLNFFGIYNKDQLIKHDLNYWHLKLYKENIDNEEKLIEINLAKEELDKFSTNQLIDFINDKNSFISQKKEKERERERKKVKVTKNFTGYIPSPSFEELNFLEDYFDELFFWEDYDEFEREEEENKNDIKEELKILGYSMGDDISKEEEKDLKNLTWLDAKNLDDNADMYCEVEDFKKANFYYTLFYICNSKIDFDELYELEKEYIQLFGNEKNYTEVESKYEMILDKINSSEESYLREENAYQMSLETCKLINKEPVDNYFNYGLQLYNVGNFEVSKKLFKKALSIDPKEEYRNYFKKANEASKQFFYKLKNARNNFFQREEQAAYQKELNRYLDKQGKYYEIENLDEYHRANLENANTVSQKVAAIVSKSLEIEIEEVFPYSEIENDLGADSMDFIELIMDLELAFDIEIPDEAAMDIETVEDAVKFIEAKIQEETPLFYRE